MASRKLNEAARQLVRERIVAGDANDEIRAALKAAKYPADLTNPTLTGYRADPDVQAALEQRRSEALEVGYADRGRRVEHLHRVAQALFVELFGSPEGTGFTEQTTHARSATIDRWLDCLREINRLVDQLPPPAASQTNVQAVVLNNPLNLQGNPLAMLVRSLEKLDGNFAATAATLLGLPSGETDAG
jgi:hypothetical protein